MGNKTEPSGESIFPFENILPMQESGQLNFIKDLQRIFRKSELGFDIFFADGHTDKQMIPHINYKIKQSFFVLIYWRQLGTFLFPMLWDMTRVILTMPENKIPECRCRQ
jgi:hypothetical protein